MLLIVHGGDHVVAGWQTLWTGRYHRTNTSRLLDSITGDPRISEALDGILGAAGSLSAARQILSRTGAWREVAKQADNFVDDAARSAQPFDILKSGGAQANKLRNKLAKLGNQAATSTGKKAATQLRSMAEKAGLKITKGSNHLNVINPATGTKITQIPHSPHSKGTIESIAKSIMAAAGF